VKRLPCLHAFHGGYAHAPPAARPPAARALIREGPSAGVRAARAAVQPCPLRPQCAARLVGRAVARRVLPLAAERPLEHISAADQRAGSH
jgi:hypothetical protein